MQHSSEVLEIVISDLQLGGTYDSLKIRNAIAGLQRVLVLLHNEEIIEAIKEIA